MSLRSWSILCVLAPLWGLGQSKTAIPFTLGVTETILSATLGEDRTLNISLPPGYHPDSAARYPVIYLLDGGADEDFIHIAGLVQFASFEWIGWLPPSIGPVLLAQRSPAVLHPSTLCWEVG